MTLERSDQDTRLELDRRTTLKAGLTVAALGGPFAGFVNSASAAVFTADPTVGLVPVRDKRDGVVRLHLPPGFNYRSFHDTEKRVVLPDGTHLPGRHDGMGAFEGPGDTVYLIRNHEINGPVGTFGPRKPYDATAGGGTTTIHTTKHGRVLDAWTSLNGTMMNCSGGRMPWGSWVTCEETVNGPDVGPDFTGAPNTALRKPHGYVFEVPLRDRRPGRTHGTDPGRPARPLTSAGRFAHEAVSFDPEEGALYLTEDNFAFASGFYRYAPEKNPMRTGHLDNNGTLEMLKVVGHPNIHLEGSFERGTTFPVEWVTIEKPDFRGDFDPETGEGTTNDEALVHVSSQGWDQGAAYFSRLEGQAFEHGVVFFTSTQGGGAAESGNHDLAGYGNGHGQVWAYDTRASELTLSYQSPGPEVLDFPDNVTTRNGTVILCEDGENDNYVRALKPDGELVNIAWNQLQSGAGEDRSDDEFAGSTFSPDGKTLFVNIQAEDGMTFAIWGPWRKLGI
jgi:secreted PhoX family phosphatase